MKLSILAVVALIAPICPAATIFEDTIVHDYSVEPNATLSIRNRDGAIWIYGADTHEVKIQAIKKAYSQERLDKIDIDISATPQQVSIETKYPLAPRSGLGDRSGTVDYVIVLPWTCKIERADLANGEVLIEGMRDTAYANLGNGRMFVHNCFANVHAQVANGGLDVAFDWWESESFAVEAEIANGNLHAYVPSDAAFHLLASSVNGHVVSDFVDKQDRQPGGVRKIDMVVSGSSSAEVKLHAVNGSIKVVEAKY
jgi:DUF4097 and DUF4098 domain-containing protein YvlB